jgi:prepilin-type N-terminal cleavage/methylation domain-containing protein
MDRDPCAGFSLIELLVTFVILGFLASIAIASPAAVKHNRDLETGLRRLRIGLDRGRMAAEHSQQPCALRLTPEGWQPPVAGNLQACRGVSLDLQEQGASPLTLRSNLPDLVRFTANGLVLDGGLVVLSHPQRNQALCLVIGLPLGITRGGIYRADINTPLSSSQCRPRDAR